MKKLYFKPELKAFVLDEMTSILCLSNEAPGNVSYSSKPAYYSEGGEEDWML